MTRRCWRYGLPQYRRGLKQVPFYFQKFIMIWTTSIQKRTKTEFIQAINEVEDMDYLNIEED